MDKQTYLIVLLGGQLALIALDLRERVLSRRRGSDANRLRPRTVLFLAATIVVYGVLQFGGLALVPSAEELVVASQNLVQRLLATGAESLVLSGFAVVLTGVAGFYFAGLCDYLFHRHVSHSRLMWFTHENHHLPTDVSTYMPGLCVRPFAVVSIFPTTAATLFSIQLVLGISGYAAWDLMPVLYIVVLVQSVILGGSHSAFLRRHWWVHKLLKPLGITTPQEHWLHHTSDLQCNYANMTTLWDRLFGTYVDPEEIAARAHRAGLPYDQDFLGTITLGKLKLSRGLRDAFQVGEFCHLRPAGDARSVPMRKRPASLRQSP